MPKTSIDSDFAAAIAATKESRKRSARNSKAPVIAKNARTLESIIAEEHLTGRNHAEELARMLREEVFENASAIERMRCNLRALAANLRTVAEELEEIEAAADDEAVRFACGVHADYVAKLDRRAAQLPRSLAKACGFISHEEWCELELRAGGGSREDWRWAPKGWAEMP